MEEELSIGEGQDQGPGEERGGLHLTGQRCPYTFEGIPPWEVAVQQIERGQMAQRLRREPVVGVDRIGTGQDS